MEPTGTRRAVLPPTLSVKDLAEKLGVSPVEVIKKLMASRILATINQVIDFATAEIVADEFGYTVEPVASEDVVAVESTEGEGNVVTTSREELFSLANEDPGKLKPPPPPRCRSSWRSTRSTRTTPTPIASISNWPSRESSRGTTAASTSACISARGRAKASTTC